MINEIPTNEYDSTQELPQTKEQNAFYAEKRREAEEKAAPAVEAKEPALPEDLRELIMQQHEALEEELSAIRQKYPDEAANTVSDLGMEFINLCACGMPSLIAYETLRAGQAQVPYMGDASGEFAADKEFFTKTEVEAMSKQQIETNYSKIRNSMKKW